MLTGHFTGLPQQSTSGHYGSARKRRVSIALRHSHTEFTDSYFVAAC